MLKGNKINSVFMFVFGVKIIPREFCKIQSINIFRIPVPYFQGRGESVYFRQVERQSPPARFGEDKLDTCIKTRIQNPFYIWGYTLQKIYFPNCILFDLMLIWHLNKLLYLSNFHSLAQRDMEMYMSQQNTCHNKIFLRMKIFLKRKHRKLLTLSFSIKGDLS